MLLDIILLKDYEIRKPQDPITEFEIYENELMEIFEFPSLIHYYFLSKETKNIRLEFVNKQLREAYNYDCEIFPVLFTLCINRSISSFNNNNKFEIAKKSFMQPTSFHTSPDIEYLSAILAPIIEMKHGNIPASSRLRLQKEEILQFKNICENLEDLYDDNAGLLKQKKKLLTKFYKIFPKVNISKKFYESIKPFLLLTKDNFKFTLQYDYFKTFIAVSELDSSFNKPLSILHLNLYTHWIDACFIVHEFPHFLTDYPGLYLKKLFCNEKYTNFMKEFFYNNIVFDLIEKKEEFFNFPFSGSPLLFFYKYCVRRSSYNRIIWLRTLSQFR